MAVVMKEPGVIDSEAAVAELYSPPRVSRHCRMLGLQPGLARDLPVVDPQDGKSWYFSKAEFRGKAVKCIKTQKPRLTVGSPVCDPFSALQTLNYPRMCPEVVRLLARRESSILPSA